MALKRETARPRLGVNIDHVATLRRLRDTPYPDVLTAARECIAGGADQITVHLREDRRHIVDADVRRLSAEIPVDLNLEMAATEEMLRIALDLRPHSICIVPEKREERTTEGGLNLSDTKRNELYRRISSEARSAGILVSYFVEPDPEAALVAKNLGAQAVEIHTGTLCIAHQAGRMSEYEREFDRVARAVGAGCNAGLLAHAGHGIDYEIAPKLARIAGILEYNIGHAIVCEALYCGLREATRKMRQALLSAQAD